MVEPGSLPLRQLGPALDGAPDGRGTNTKLPLHGLELVLRRRRRRRRPLSDRRRSSSAARRTPLTENATPPLLRALRSAADGCFGFSGVQICSAAAAAAATFGIGFSGVKNWSANAAAAAAFPIFCGVATPAAVLALLDGVADSISEVDWIWWRWRRRRLLGFRGGFK